MDPSLHLNQLLKSATKTLNLDEEVYHSLEWVRDPLPAVSWKRMKIAPTTEMATTLFTRIDLLLVVHHP
jgi:hypothetical protein